MVIYKEGVNILGVVWIWKSGVLGASISSSIWNGDTSGFLKSEAGVWFLNITVDINHQLMLPIPSEYLPL